jgi:hypothetical protein
MVYEFYFKKSNKVFPCVQAWEPILREEYRFMNPKSNTTYIYNY